MIQMLRQAVDALNSGNFERAISLAEEARAARPQDGTISQLLGVAYAQSGDLPTGARYFRTALKQGQDNLDNRLNLARTLIELGEFDEAHALCISQDQNHSEVLTTLALLERKRGRLDDAERYYRAVTSREPNNGVAQNNLGSLYLDMARHHDAIKALAQAIRIFPNSAIAYLNLGRAYLGDGQPENACRSFERAAMLDRANPLPLLELSRTLNAIGHSEAALRAIGAAAKLAPKSAENFIQMGIVFEDLQRPDDAIKAFDAAYHISGGNAEAALHLAILYDQSNALDQMQLLLQRLRTEHGGSGARAYVEALSAFRGKDYDAASEWLGRIDQIAISPAVVAQFAAQVADKRGDVNAAIDQLKLMKAELANSHLAKTVDRDVYTERLRSFAQQIKTASSKRRAIDEEKLDSGNSPIFLVGFPRSGTTLLDTLLMGHADFHVMEELPIFSQLSSDLVDLNDVENLADEQIFAIRKNYYQAARINGKWDGVRRLVDKNPMLQPRAAVIHRIFPDAQFIYAYRHPCDVLLSCYMQSFKPIESMAAFLDIEAAAAQYDATMAVWDLSRNKYPIRIHDICYEKLVRNPDAEFANLLEFLGADWDSSALDHRQTVAARGHVRTPSYAQIAEPINANAVERWKRYQALLDPVLPHLKPWIAYHGYAAT